MHSAVTRLLLMYEPRTITSARHLDVVAVYKGNMLCLHVGDMG